MNSSPILRSKKTACAFIKYAFLKEKALNMLFISLLKNIDLHMFINIVDLEICESFNMSSSTNDMIPSSD